MRSKVDRYLSGLEQAFGSLAAVASRREAMARAGVEADDQLADRLAFQDEWWDQIDRLETLCIAHDAAEMSDEQLSQFASLCATILEQLPLVPRLDLRSPSTSIVEVVRRAAEHSIMAKGA